MKTQPPVDLDAVRASYDAVADNYLDMVGDPGPWPRAALDAFAEEVREIGPALDAGCGPGWISDYLHRKGVDVSGIDLSPRMIEHARQQYPAVSFEVASVTELDPKPGSLGGVLGWWSWFNLPREYLPDVIATMAHALRPGGQLIIGTHRGAGYYHPRTRCYGRCPRRVDDAPLRTRGPDRDAHRCGTGDCGRHPTSAAATVAEPAVDRRCSPTTLRVNRH